jgi:hypothetical protein
MGVTAQIRYDLRGRDSLLHRCLDVLSIQFAHDQVGISDPNIDKEIQDRYLQLVCYLFS